MPITIVSGNLNQYGNTGQFESDRSTWGYADSAYISTRSSAQQTAGLYSAHVQKSSLSDLQLLPCRWFSELGKKYFLKAKVRVPAGAPVGDDADIITLEISLNNFLLCQTLISKVDKTVLEATDTWVEIEAYYEHTNALFASFNEVSHIHLNGTGILDGEIYVDQFEVYEFTGTPDEEPEPEPEEPDETDDTYLSKNPITLSKNATIDWEEEENYRLYCDVRVEDEADSGEYNSKLKVDLPPTSAGQVVFYLRQAFRDCFAFIPPSLNSSAISRLTDRIKRFKCFTGELIGTEITPEDLEDNGADLVLYGGIDKINYPGLNYLSTYLPTNKKFLTWAPVEKHVDRLQEDYLNFWIYSDTIGSLKLQAKAYYDDNTDETDIVATLDPVQYRSLYQIPAGPANCGVALINPAKNLTHYELTLLDQDDEAISETRTYYINLVRKPLTRFFMFVNSLGAHEVLCFTGQAAEETSFDREIVQKFLPHDYSALDGEFAANSVFMQAKNEYSSGHIKDRLAAQWHDYMKDFLLSPQIFDVTDGTRIPVVITGGSWKKEDQNYQRFIRFEAKPAYDNDSYTPSL